jgi:CO/xanthine dehydrogenase Mo-binding subunit
MDEGAFSSRQTYNAGNAVKLACLDLKKEIFERAAKKLNASPNALTLNDGLIHVEDDMTQNMKLQDLFTSGKTRFGAFLEEGGALIGKATFYQDSGELNIETGQCTTDRFVAFYEYATANVDLEVNTETGHVKIIEFTAATDVGKALNPKTVEGQIEGAIAMGLGATLSEELVLENGKPVNADLKDYKAPYGLDAPKLKPIILETAYKGGPFGAKGCGEAAIVGVAPAIANAIADAVGVRIKDLPITPERVRKALEEKSK